MNGTQSWSRVTGRKLMPGKRQLVPDSSPVLLGSIGFDGKLKFLSPAWERILGYRAQELQGRPLWELMQHERPVAVALVDRLLAGDSFERLEFGLRCKDGACKWFLWQRRLDSDAIFIVGYDITEQKSQQIASLLRTYERTKRADAAV